LTIFGLHFSTRMRIHSLIGFCWGYFRQLILLPLIVSCLTMGTRRRNSLSAYVRNSSFFGSRPWIVVVRISTASIVL
jgi:hypothetical protein